MTKDQLEARMLAFSLTTRSNFSNLCQGMTQPEVASMLGVVSGIYAVEMVQRFGHDLLLSALESMVELHRQHIPAPTIH